MAETGSGLALDEQASLPVPSRRRRRRKKQPLPPLFDGQSITCPRCREKTSILAIETLPEMPVYMDETVPVFRCKCSFIFALRSDPVYLPRRTPS